MTIRLGIRGSMLAIAVTLEDGRRIDTQPDDGMFVPGPNKLAHRLGGK